MLEYSEALDLLRAFRREFENTNCPKCEILMDNWLPSEGLIEKWLKEYPGVIRSHAGDGESSSDLG